MSQPKVRVTLVNVEKGHKAVVLVKNTYEAVIEASRNKLRLGGRSSHNAKRNNTQTSTKVVDDRSLFVWTLSPRAMLLEEDTLSLRNGDTVYISKYPPPEGSVPESSSSESSSVKSVRENSSFPTQILIPVTSDASHVIARVEKTMHIPTPAPTSVHPCQPEISFTHGHEQEQPKTMDRKNTRKNIRTDATYHGNPGQGPGCLTFDWFSCVEGKGVELHYSWVESGVPGDNLATDSSEIGKTRKRHSRLHNKTPTRTGRQFRASLDTYLPESCAFAVGMAIASWLVMGYAAEELHVRCGLLNEQQKQFWVTLYQNALSEFYYINDIPVPDFKITCEGPLIDPYGVTVETAVADVGDIKLTNGPKRALVPLGGGKDSLVALERLRASGYECTLLYVGGEPGEYIANWRLPALVSATGCDVLLVELDLGDCWTAEFEHDKADVKMITPPFSALVAFISAGIAAMNGFDFVAVGNECSANEGNGLIASGPNCDVQVNHQYDKSFSFELQANSYIARYVSPGVQYFSALMDVWELDIAAAFCRFPVYLPLFISCNQAIHTSRWCARCSKCAFVFLLLSAYLDPPIPWAVFGDNLFTCESMWPIFEDLMGFGIHKPFECVGTSSESRVALKLARDRYKNYSCNTNVPLPVFLAYHARMLDKTPSCLPRPVTPLASGDRKLIPDGVVPLSEVTPSPSHI